MACDAAQQTPPKPLPPIEPPRTPFGSTVAGAGIVEAETENIAIGSPLPGVVMEVYVPVEKVGQRVQAGDKLFLVDTRALEAQLKLQQANLAAAKAQLELNEATLRLAKVTNKRFKDLYKGNAGAVSEMQLDQYQAQQDQAEASIALAKAAIQQAEAQIGQTRTDIDRSLVRAAGRGEGVAGERAAGGVCRHSAVASAGGIGERSQFECRASISTRTTFLGHTSISNRAWPRMHRRAAIRASGFRCDLCASSRM